MTYQIIVAGYDCYDYAGRCLDSIAGQTLTDYNVCVVNDASTDERMEPFLRTYCKGMGWAFLQRELNAGALRSQHEGITLLDPKEGDVIVWCDLDDSFSSEGSLAVLDSYYDENTLMTYGSYSSVPYSETCPAVLRYPPECEAENDYRNMSKWGIRYNHLRTVRWELYRQLIPQQDFFFRGKWMDLASDCAVMIPCLEMAGGRYKVIPEILYNYSSDNALSEWRKAPNGTDKSHAALMRGPKKKPIVWEGNK